MRVIRPALRNAPIRAPETGTVAHHRIRKVGGRRVVVNNDDPHPALRNGAFPIEECGDPRAVGTREFRALARHVRSAAGVARSKAGAVASAVCLVGASKDFAAGAGVARTATGLQ